MCGLLFTSTLEPTYLEPLEQIFCFNRNQERLSDAIALAIERYGIPRISVVKDRLWITFESGVQTQSLFVLGVDDAKTELLGVIVYTRENDKLVVLFMAVREDHAHGGVCGDQLLLIRMLEEVRDVGRRVKGIMSVTVFLPGQVTACLPVKDCDSKANRLTSA